jgi:pimeloyl-ACP methyl ester carboxylesterase
MMKKWVFALPFLALILTSCSSGVAYGPQVEETFSDEHALVQEVRFKSNGFKIVGDLRLPAEGETYSAIILVHGSGDATRDGAVPFNPLIEIFLRNDYAVFSWDKPRSGESTGKFEGGHMLTQRAIILADGIKVLTEHPAIDETRVGLWGISQAGWVIPKALGLTEDIAFMIVVGGGGENSIEQMAYQVGQRVICNSGSVEQATLVEQYWPQFAKATSYAEYREAVEALLMIPGVKDYTGLEITAEDYWKPWPRDSDAFYDPMTDIEHTTIPVLVFFGELDKNIDPVQGAEAYENALRKAENQDYQIEVIPGVGHILVPMETGCIGESGGREYAPEYLKTLEEWLQHLS